jgi:hypothetical protein
VFAHGDRLLESALAGFADHHRAGGLFCGRDLGRRREVALAPLRDEVSGVAGVGTAGQQMIGAVEGDEAFRVPGGGEDGARIIDRNHLVGRRVQNHQGLAHTGDLVEQAVLGDVIEEIAADAELPPTDADSALTAFPDHRDLIGEQVGDMAGVRRGTDGGDRPRLGDTGGRRQYRSSAEAVSDQQRRRLPSGAQVVGGSHQIIDVGGEVGVGEFAFAGAQSGEVEAQNSDAAGGERIGDPSGCAAVLAAGEAVRE